MRKEKIYLAGPLFGLADRAHNLRLQDLLVKLGYEVILPQAEAATISDIRLYLQAVKNNCLEQAGSSELILVANLDGPDADSGTSSEVGVRQGLKLPWIGYRTDFRTDQNLEVGFNAMLQQFDYPERIIIKPCFAKTKQELDQFYVALAIDIDGAIKSLKAS